MSTPRTAHRLRDDRLFRSGLLTTALAFLACLGTHLLALLGAASAVAWRGGVEHALVLLTLGAAALTAWAA